MSDRNCIAIDAPTEDSVLRWAAAERARRFAVAELDRRCPGWPYHHHGLCCHCGCTQGAKHQRGCVAAVIMGVTE